MLKTRTSPDNLPGRWAWLGLLMACLLLTACAAELARPASTIKPQASFSTSGQTPLPDQWWQTFEDPTLNRLVNQALAGNFGLQRAWDRLDQARASARKAGAEASPLLTGETGLSSSRVRANGGTEGAQNFSLGLAASYEIDLWGRIRSSKEAAALDAQTSHELLQTAALTLSAQVASTWFQLLEQQGQLELLGEQLQTNQQTLDLINLQFRTGQVGIADLLQQRQVVESRRGELAQAGAQKQRLINQLTALLGVPPDQAPQLPLRAFGQLPPLPATGLPSKLIERRPDLRASWLQLQAANQRIAAAVADQFPRLSLTARASTSDEQIVNLFDGWLTSIAANLLGPIVDGDRRRAEVERSRAVAAEALHAYSQTLLTALTEVEEALTLEQKQQDYLASIEQQLALAEQSTVQIRNRYLNGAENYQRVLASTLSEQRLQRIRLTARSELFRNRINLCRALAGGWQQTRPLKQTQPQGE